MNIKNNLFTDLISEAELARWLGVELRAVQALRRIGKGPKYVRVSSKQFRYRPLDIEDWLIKQTLETPLGEE